MDFTGKVEGAWSPSSLCSCPQGALRGASLFPSLSLLGMAWLAPALALTAAGLAFLSYFYFMLFQVSIPIHPHSTQAAKSCYTHLLDR